MAQTLAKIEGHGNTPGCIDLGADFQGDLTEYAECQQITALAFDGRPRLNAGDIADFGFLDKFTVGAWVKLDAAGDGVVVARMAGNARSEGYSLTIRQGAVGVNLVKRWLDDAIRVETARRLEPGAWHHLMLTYDGSRVAAGMLAPVAEVEFGAAGRRLLDLGLRSAALWPGFSEELAERTGLDVGLRRTGTLLLAADGDEAAELERQLEFRRSLGLDVRRLAPSAARDLEPALAPTETPAHMLNSRGIVTCKSPCPTSRPSTNSLMFAGTPLPCGMSGFPVGVNSKLKIWSPSGTPPPFDSTLNILSET